MSIICLQISPEGAIYFEVNNISSNKALRVSTVRLISAPIRGLSGVQLYIAADRLPTPNDFDYSDQTSKYGPSVTINIIESNRYYIMFTSLQSAKSSKTTRRRLRIRIDMVGLTLGSFEPKAGGHGGQVTMQVEETRWTSNTNAYLISRQDDRRRERKIYPKRVFRGHTHVYLTFDLSNANLGYYLLHAYNHNEHAVALEQFQVKRPHGPWLVTKVLGGGQVVRPNWLIPFTIRVWNKGDIDTPVPWIEIYVKGSESSTIGWKPSLNGVYKDRNLKLVMQERHGPLDVIRPGGKATVTIYVRAGSEGDIIVGARRMIAPIAPWIKPAVDMSTWTARERVLERVRKQVVSAQTGGNGILLKELSDKNIKLAALLLAAFGSASFRIRAPEFPTDRVAYSEPRLAHELGRRSHIKQTLLDRLVPISGVGDHDKIIETESFNMLSNTIVLVHGFQIGDSDKAKQVCIIIIKLGMCIICFASRFYQDVYAAVGRHSI